LGFDAAQRLRRALLRLGNGWPAALDSRALSGCRCRLLSACGLRRLRRLSLSALDGLSLGGCCAALPGALRRDVNWRTEHQKRQ